MVEITRLFEPDTGPVDYQTLAQEFTVNAQRHALRGMQYIAEGKPDYAEGSFKKAVRNAKRARALEFEGLITNTIAARIAADIEDLLISGPDDLVHEGIMPIFLHPGSPISLIKE